jgi:UDP-N-acetyl-D-mannosaminuronic acid dehydrogenase
LPAAFAGSGAELVSLNPALREAAIVVVLVDHTAFKHLGSDDLAGKLVYDARGMLRR